MNLAVMTTTWMRRGGWRALTLAIVVQLMSLASFAQQADEPDPDESEVRATTSVGMKGTLEQIKLPGPQLETIPIEGRESPFILRIVRVFPHGDAWRYDFEFYGLEPGKYDLRDHLRRQDGSTLDSLPPLRVDVAPVLAEEVIRPNPLTAGTLPRFFPYRFLLGGLAFIWLIGLGVLLFYRQRRRTKATELARPLSLAEQLETRIARAVTGAASDGELAALERSLISYWRRRLQLNQLPASEALPRLLADPQAGGLLRQLEQWLHSPRRDPPADMEGLLAPYRNLPADAVELPEASREGKS